MMEKSRSGMVDMYHEVIRDYPARIKLSEDGRQIVNSNCMRCHSATMEGVYVGMGAKDTSDCMKCHSRIAHGSNYHEGGIKVE
jgi:cytochrome c nitrite reductase small subunit